MQRINSRAGSTERATDEREEKSLRSDIAGLEMKKAPAPWRKAKMSGLIVYLCPMKNKASTWATRGGSMVVCADSPRSTGQF